MLPTKLYHYSAQPLKKLRQDFHDMHWARIPIFQKPHGFWISVEDYPEDQNWYSWCEGEEFRPECLEHRYHVILKKKAKILHLKNAEELEAFSLKYASNDPEDFNKKFPMEYMDNLTGYVRKPYIYLIDWQTVMKEYDGIIIAPYQWSCRLMNQTTSWYYGWDCASGCIWNISAVRSFTLQPRLVETQECQAEGIQTDSRSAVCCLQG